MFGIQSGQPFGMPNCMVAVLATNLVPNMGQFLPPFNQWRIFGYKNGTFNAATKFRALCWNANNSC
jgi:hypothetical protein